jgi:hypothetical protein
VTANPLAVIVTELRRFGIPHILAGSFASACHGDPRTTRDIDLVVDPTRDALAGVEVSVATAEDTIVAKLERARAGESERQLRDGVGILETSGERLDRGYLERWIEELGLRSLWDRARSEAGGSGAR